jgi:hypothetical protein
VILLQLELTVEPPCKTPPWRAQLTHKREAEVLSVYSNIPHRDAAIPPDQGDALLVTFDNQLVGDVPGDTRTLT